MENPVQVDLRRMRGRIQQAEKLGAKSLQRARFGMNLATPWTVGAGVSMWAALEFTNLNENMSKGVEVGYIALGGLIGALIALKHYGARPIHDVKQWRKYKKQAKDRQAKYDLAVSAALGPKPLDESQEEIVKKFAQQLDQYGQP